MKWNRLIPMACLVIGGFLFGVFCWTRPGINLSMSILSGLFIGIGGNWIYDDR